MAKYPVRIQSKIEKYTSALASRFPPSIAFYKLSIGYSKSDDARLDSTPVTVIYTSDDTTPTNGLIVYTDQTKKNTYDGSNLWHSVFDSSNASIGRLVRIDTGGNIISELRF